MQLLICDPRRWSLTSLKENLIKIGAKVIIHGRYVAFQMAEIAIPKALFAGILRMIGELRPPRDSVRRSYVLRSLKLTENIRLDDGKFGTF